MGSRRTRVDTVIIQENFFESPDDIRELALQQEFYSAKDHPHNIGGFPGMRTDYFNNIIPDFYDAIKNPILSHIIKEDTKFSDYYLQTAFSYTLADTPCNKHVDFERGYMGYEQAYAGVTYLNPNPPENSGTSVEDGYAANVYNRFVMYDAFKEHYPAGSFGYTKEDGRMVMTYFLLLK